MSDGTSTITSKWQVTIPEAVRSELPLQIGQRISWRVEGEQIIGQRVRTILELAGSLKPLRPNSQAARPKKAPFAKGAINRYKRVAAR